MRVVLVGLMIVASVPVSEVCSMDTSSFRASDNIEDVRGCTSYDRVRWERTTWDRDHLWLLPIYKRAKIHRSAWIIIK